MGAEGYSSTEKGFRNTGRGHIQNAREGILENGIGRDTAARKDLKGLIA